MQPVYLELKIFQVTIKYAIYLMGILRIAVIAVTEGLIFTFYQRLR